MDQYANYQYGGPLENDQPIDTYSTAYHSNYINPSVIVKAPLRSNVNSNDYLARAAYPQQQQHFYGNWSSYSSNSMERDASHASDSSSSSYPSQSSQGTTPPADYPDDQDDNQCKSNR